jgi:basic membrane lipoprotein Med (substrate-binding protein (PBP1-ABC) superfamily)
LDDAYGNEDAVRRVARDYPTIAFVLGSGLGPVVPNVSIFDNWLYEPAYLCGLIAGTVTKSHKIGVVGGYPIPEVNSIVNAFIAGVKEVNAQVHVSVRFIQAWFDSAAAKQAALAQIDASTLCLALAPGIMPCLIGGILSTSTSEDVVCNRSRAALGANGRGGAWHLWGS